MNLSKIESYCIVMLCAVAASACAIVIASALWPSAKDYAPGDMNVRVDPLTCVEYARFQYGPDHQSYVLRVDRSGNPVLFGPCVDGK